MASARTRSQVIGLSLLAIDRAAQESLRRQLYARVRDAIVRGEMRAGFRLPSTRSVAKELALSRNTVGDVFAQLVAEGYLVARHGSGTYVASNAIALTGRAAASKPHGSWERASLRGRLLAAVPDYSRLDVKRPLPFQVGIPDLERFPFETWSRIATRLMRRPRAELVSYGDPAGYRPLREVIAAELRARKGIACRDDQIVVVGGTQQALDLICRLTLDPGDEVWVEDPSSRNVRAAFAGAGCTLVPVPVDGDGIDVARGRELAPRARLSHVTSAHQWPLGPTLTAPRRAELLRWAAAADALVVEDEYDGVFRYDGEKPVPLRALEGGERVIWIGSFSLTTFPGLRVGYLVAPPQLVDAFVAAKAAADRQTSSFEQATLAEFIYDGHFHRHRTRMRAIYAERAARLVTLMREQAGIEIAPPHAGLHVILPLPGQVDDRALSLRASDAGVIAQPLSPHYVAPDARRGLLLGFGVADLSAIEKTVPLLARCVAGAAPRPRALRPIPPAARDLPG
ncbi:MAG TPA: PLP-dependent aminotransferase family protein [Candidatus Elarobacter sp.]|jgi:GntR family transcriptional regulator/MocR family aminotransferase|nr:PLP-dependent aminotransferase family protein [Candidatus Elarobacter sp.]